LTTAHAAHAPRGEALTDDLLSSSPLVTAERAEFPVSGRKVSRAVHMLDSGAGSRR